MKDNLFIEKYPEIAKEWDYEKNEGIDINTISYGSRIVVWWKCDKGHTWQASLLHRVCDGRSCGRCKEAKKKYDENDHNDQKNQNR